MSRNKVIFKYFTLRCRNECMRLYLCSGSYRSLLGHLVALPCSKPGMSRRHLPCSCSSKLQLLCQWQNLVPEVLIQEAVELEYKQDLLSLTLFSLIDFFSFYKSLMLVKKNSNNTGIHGVKGEGLPHSQHPHPKDFQWRQPL